ncbi:rho GTPase-activating protein 10 [Erpetoichthys calabaricus]|nr:rho GTPase-activating protein 10 [Erpetoichthys calabaricus]XP_051784099.1 rho GTPase-activating protein 10 [Erpetoichthys calabaricus]XP_051784100.1 rho GTPase-activating protein 10 [Erpetoichthys calabaricus]XP_051784101.1 rho GTPase-activating protein 10 [Erpetoichthys calabaricus]XP_051784102.1 rho GTPase-activating protein 10 [Erpetoichthys calabaricus]XP_051784103.1 rho GTPase-activating protein 10 [Erpetoichthys calabaricus]XP_051784104.1 rho GTPase-activating protein 10 [Erpetoicht
MGLHPLEFSDCYLDSPKFRERIRAHELELEKTNRFIKELQKDGKNLFAATKNIIAAQRKFAQSLSDFKFEYIGDAKTDDEKCIDESLHEFSVFLKNLEDQREIMMININETLLKPLEKFRKEQLGAAKEERKKYEKETEKYYTALDKLLNLSAKKKDQQLQEADIQVEQMRHHFHEESLEYVYKLQEIQERKKFECVEPMVAFFQGVFTFYHQGYELANDFNHYKTELQINIQNTRNRFEGTRSEVIELKNKVKQNPQEHLQTSRLCNEGYLYVQEKRPPPFGSSWVKKYCTYMKEQKIFNMFSFDPRSGGKMGEPESVILKSCTKKPMDSIDRRFCLEIEVTDRQGLVITVQALSEEDRKQWMEAMGGKESVSTLCRTYAKREGIEAHLNEVGFSLVKNCIRAVESRGIKDQGLYRVVGVSSRVQKLLNILIDEKSYTEVDLSASEDWEIKTVTSALKQYLRSLPEPLMTYGLYKEFIVPAKCGTPESRVHAIHYLVHKLLEENREMLDMLIRHLAKVSENCKENLMTVANLGVVFGPTLMRSEEETVAAIMDLKFQNIVVEILIENYETIFKTVPNSSCTAALSSSPSAPPRLSRRQSQRQNRPLAVYNPQMELQPVECPNSVREDTLVDSTESVSSHSSNATTSSASGSPPEKAKNRRRSSAGEFFDLDSHSFISWLNIPSPTSPASPNENFLFMSTNVQDDKSSQRDVCRRARAKFSCEAGHSSELSFQVGAIFEDVVTSKEPGWLEGSLSGRRGLIPENYVEFL